MLRYKLQQRFKQGTKFQKKDLLFSSKTKAYRAFTYTFNGEVIPQSWLFYFNWTNLGLKIEQRCRGNIKLNYLLKKFQPKLVNMNSILTWIPRTFVFERLLGQWNTGNLPHIWWKNLTYALSVYGGCQMGHLPVENNLQSIVEHISFSWLSLWRLQARRLSRKLRKIVRNAYHYTVTYNYVPHSQRLKLAYRLFRLGLIMSTKNSLKAKLVDLFEKESLDLSDHPNIWTNLKNKNLESSEESISSIEETEKTVEEQPQLAILSRITLINQRSQVLTLLAKVGKKI